MLARIRTFFDTRLAGEHTEDSERALQLAACALLFEMVKADFAISAQELASLRDAAKAALDIDDGTADELIALAEQEAEAATSLYQFTRLVNDHYTVAQKARLTKALWRVAYADGHIDKYEENYLRKLGNLLYVPHTVFIQTKLEVQRERAGQ